MNRDPENFEQRLHRQPLRPVPAEWRADILQAAQVAQADARPHRSPARVRASWLHALSREFIVSLWPNSKVWAGLAAVWVLIAVLNFSMSDHTAPVVATEKPLAPSAVQMAELRNQQRLFAELSGQTTSPDADRPKNLPPKPRSEHVGFRTI